MQEQIVLILKVYKLILALVSKGHANILNVAQT